MSDSILNTTKKLVGISENYEAFDIDIMTHINTVFTTLQQLGIGPVEGFMIEDATINWDAFLGDDPRLNSVKTYMVLRVRMLFDPPTSFHLHASIKEEIAELEWRLSVHREEETWVPPVRTTSPDWVAVIPVNDLWV